MNVGYQFPFHSVFGQKSKGDDIIKFSATSPHLMRKNIRAASLTPETSVKMIYENGFENLFF